MLKSLAIIIFLSLFSAQLPAAQPGEEFQVNTYTIDQQRHPSVAMDKKGNFVVTWESLEQDGSLYGVFAIRFNKNGKPVSSEFRVNTYTSNDQRYPAIAMNSKGNFVITWESWGQDGSLYGIFAQRFNKKGKTLGSEFRVNIFSSKDQRHPSVAMDSKGNFVIAWESWGQDGSLYGIFARRFSKSGKPAGPEFRVNTNIENDQRAAAIAMNSKGNFVIAWESWGQDGSLYGIFARRFSKSGKPAGPEFRVNSYTSNDQRHPAVAIGRKGNFIIAWESLEQDGSFYGIYARRFNKSGNIQGPEFRVNTYALNDQRAPAVAMDKKGNFVITWESWKQDSSLFGIFAHRFDKKGETLDPEFQVNTYTTGDQRAAAIAMNSKGIFIIAWESWGQDGDHSGIFGTKPII